MQVKNPEQVRLLLKRIKKNKMVDGDGQALIDYLQSLSDENYQAFKRHGYEHDQMHKGYAIAIDSLIESFATCDKRRPPSKKDEGLAFT